MIEFESVSKSYPDGTIAIGELSLIVPTGSIVVLAGSSGSGKTTLLRMVNRMLVPTSGRVLIDGKDVAAADPVKLRRSIGYVLQSGGLLPHRTVVENISVVPRLNGASRKAARARAFDMLELVGLDSILANRYPTELSGGQQQRVGVARALASKPKILLMDEPFGSVDPIVRRGLQQELQALQGRLGTTVLFVTHDIDEALTLADELVIVRSGGVVAQRGSPTEILTRPADDFVAAFVGVERAQRCLRLNTEHGIELVYEASSRLVGAPGQ